MDRYILKALEGEFLWYDESPPVVLNQSAFVPYTNRPISNQLPHGVTKSMNMNMRMLQFLRKSWQPATARYEAGDDAKERGFRHMINERMRREKQKHSYLALHSMLPAGTRNDKNWTVQMATMNIQQLKRSEEELRKKNMELETLLVENEKERVKWAKIKLKVANPTSGIDSMLEVLKCLQHLGLKARSISSNFSLEEFSAELEIESKIGAAEIEEYVQETLYEAERKLRFPFPGSREEYCASIDTPFRFD